MRSRKPRINLVGFKNDHGVVVRTDKPNKWVLKCNACHDEHEQSGRDIQRNSAPKKCPKYKPSNWSGLEREDAIMRRIYGISLKDFDALLEFQGGGCAICAKPIDAMRRRMNVDHDHKTGKVRGILCSGCNTGLGHLGDNVEGLKRALYYLENSPFKEFKYANAR